MSSFPPGTSRRSWRAAAGAAVLATLLATPAAAQAAAEPFEVTYWPWSKFCIGDDCFTGADGMTDCGSAVAAVLVASRDERARTLRIFVKAANGSGRPVRIAIDESAPRSQPTTTCSNGGCWSEFEADQDLVDRLKSGQQLVVEDLSAANRPRQFNLPLSGFESAYHGPNVTPVVRMETSTKAEMELRAERTRVVREAHQARCQGQ